MASTRLRLSGASLEELSAQLRAEHGPQARIIAAERVTVGGIGGFLARRHYEVTVELPEPEVSGGHNRQGAQMVIAAPRRVGIAALLDDADQAELTLHREVAGQEPSTASHAFAELMDDLAFQGLSEADASPQRAASTDVADSGVPAGAAPVPVSHRRLPVPLAQPGDLVVVVGLKGDALRVARTMAGAESVIRVAGSEIGEGAVRIEDRRGALAARAAAVARGGAVFVACGWGETAPGVLSAIQADQVWVAVDVRRKPDDTARWVASVSATVPVDGVAVEGSDDTSSPETVHELGLPVGWVDGLAPAATPIIHRTRIERAIG